MHQMPALLSRAVVRRGRDRSLVPVAVLGTAIILLMASVPANAWHDHLRSPCLKTRRVYTFTFCVSMLAAAIFGVRALRTFGAAGTPRDSVFRREARGGLSITAHFVVGCAADALEQAVLAALVALVSWSARRDLVGFENHWLLFVLVAWISSGWAHLFAWLFRDASVAFVAYVTCTTSLCCLGSGAIEGLQFSGLYRASPPAQALAALSPGRWITEWILVAHWRAMPAQYGATRADAALPPQLGPGATSWSPGDVVGWGAFPCPSREFEHHSFALHDIETVQRQSVSIWWWPVPRMLAAGLALRSLALAMMWWRSRGLVVREPLPGARAARRVLRALGRASDPGAWAAAFEKAVSTTAALETRTLVALFATFLAAVLGAAVRVAQRLEASRMARARALLYFEDTGTCPDGYADACARWNPEGHPAIRLAGRA
jgi:hypothetical protein